MSGKQTAYGIKMVESFYTFRLHVLSVPRKVLHTATSRDSTAFEVLAASA